MSGNLRVECVTIDCADPHRLAGFWSALLSVGVKEIGGDYAELEPPAAGVPYLLFLQVPEGKAAKNRVHLDLVTANVAMAVDQALTLGARRAPEPHAGPFNWVVLQDPEGNEFCICPENGSDPPAS